jgi:hypothetical protein
MNRYYRGFPPRRASIIFLYLVAMANDAALKPSQFGRRNGADI